MKKRIISTLVTATVALTTFWGGQMTNATVQANEKTYIAVEDIVDWNTDGKELSLALRDDAEAYAYKSQDDRGCKGNGNRIRDHHDGR